MTGISNFTISKTNRGANVQTDILLRVCEAFNYNIGDICDAVPVNNEE